MKKFLLSALLLVPAAAARADEDPVTTRKIGTRHRAAIGVTDDTDALAVVLSEERGEISIAWRGELVQDVGIDRLRDRLIHHATGRTARKPV